MTIWCPAISVRTSPSAVWVIEEVCVGDRYRIGEAEFEVTQPRVTCFRVGIRLGEPRDAKTACLPPSPGVLFPGHQTKGRVEAGDEIVRTHRGRHELSIAEVDAMLYLPDRAWTGLPWPSTCPH